MSFIGIDLGTSFIKSAVLDLEARRLELLSVRGTGTALFEVSTKQQGLGRGRLVLINRAIHSYDRQAKVRRYEGAVFPQERQNK